MVPLPSKQKGQTMRALSLTGAGQLPARRPMSALFGRIMSALERRRALHELTRLDDHMLSDIGISRSDIRRVVDGIRY
jgi:uncharacterized protein YjiS (DUF1127 family)